MKVVFCYIHLEDKLVTLTCCHSGLKKKCRVMSTIRQLVTLVVCDVNYHAVGDTCGMWCQLSHSW